MVMKLDSTPLHIGMVCVIELKDMKLSKDTPMSRPGLPGFSRGENMFTRTLDGIREALPEQFQNLAGSLQAGAPLEETPTGEWQQEQLLQWVLEQPDRYEAQCR